MEKTFTEEEFLEKLDVLVVDYIQSVLKLADVEVTKPEARNILAKLGKRVLLALA